MTLKDALLSPQLKKTWPWIWSSLPVLLLLDYQAVAPFGNRSILLFQFPYFIGILASALAVVVLPFALLRRSSRMLVLAWLVAAIAYLPLAVGGFILGSRIRSWGFDRLAERSDPLVSAIRAYTDANGHPPSVLGELVPAFLPRTPRTGIMAYPDYQYYAGTNAARFDGNPWVLVVHTPSGGINFDQFLYFPLQNYPSRGYGGSLARIRDWAYVHE